LEIYFAGSIRAGRDDVATYRTLVAHLKQYGDVLTEHVGDYALSLHGQSHLSDSYIHDRDLEWLHDADIVVAEVTTPSLGVGYEIATAVHQRTPVLALYRGERDRLSAMIAGSAGVTTVPYTELPEALGAIDTKLAEMVR
jgi:2'-deoxynucleoside 5'-phosphate N-hydrolase